jgi:hypothetical protein
LEESALFKAMDSMLWVWAGLGVNGEIIEVKRLLFRILSHAEKSPGTSRRVSSKGPSLYFPMYKVDRQAFRTKAESFPAFQTVTQMSPQFRRMTGDFVPVVTTEEEVVRARALSYPRKIWVTSLRGDVASEDGTEDSRRDARDAQQRVPSKLAVFATLSVIC